MTTTQTCACLIRAKGTGAGVAISASTQLVSGATINYCPLHAAAEDMRRALAGLVAALKWQPSGRVYAVVSDKKLTAALAAAEEALKP